MASRYETAAQAQQQSADRQLDELLEKLKELARRQEQEAARQKLRALGAGRQALCVTHLPQVAAHGHAHYRVSKSETAGATHSAVEVLDAKAREEEIARMLGGATVGKEARAAARRLLSDAAS